MLIGKDKLVNGKKVSKKEFDRALDKWCGKKKRNRNNRGGKNAKDKS